MNLLITGGAGFIGSHFVLRHVEQYPDDKIVVIDALTYAADISFLSPVMDEITFVEGDIVNQTSVEKILKEHSIDTIINFAAETHVDNSITNASPFLRTNIMGTQSLIEACRANNVRLLHISTDEVYGDIDDDDPPCTVGHTLWPSSPYAASKAAAEMLVFSAMRTYNLPACITRCTNNYGPHQAAEKFIPTVIRKALNGEPIPVYGEGKNKRDWLYVTDHTDAIELILHTDWAFEDQPDEPGSGGHLFNISADNEKENIEVCKIILGVLEKPEDLIEFVEDRPGHDWRYALDSSNTRDLGWEPKVSFEEGLKKTVEWFRHKIV